MQNARARAELATLLTALTAVVGILTACMIVGCISGEHRHSVAGSPPEDWRRWQVERENSVAGTNGWTTVVGLHWLSEGTHSVGSGRTAVVPLAGPERLGDIRRTTEEVWFIPATRSECRANGEIIREPLRLLPDIPGPANQIVFGSQRFWLLQRGERFAIRVKNSEARARREFRGLKFFPWRSEWQINARFDPHPPGTTLSISDVTGSTQAEPNPGAIIFVYKGQEYRLEALADMEAGDLFVLFRDETNGTSTYAPGRFLHTAYPDTLGRILIDFNRAYNPPCAFTDFATCPRAPAQNRLPFPVLAGEKKYE